MNRLAALNRRQRLRQLQQFKQYLKSPLRPSHLAGRARRCEPFLLLLDADLQPIPNCRPH
jgi:hypothetical protein